MESEDIKRLAYEVHRFADSTNWSGSNPLAVLIDFDTIEELVRGRIDVRAALPPELMPYGEFERVVSDGEIEFDLGQVKLRLRCKQICSHPQRGPLAAVEASSYVAVRRD